MVREALNEITELTRANGRMDKNQVAELLAKALELKERCWEVEWPEEVVKWYERIQEDDPDGGSSWSLLIMAIATAHTDYQPGTCQRVEDFESAFGFGR